MVNDRVTDPGRLPFALPFQGEIEGVIADVFGEGEEGPTAEPLSIPAGDIDAFVGGGPGPADDLSDRKTDRWLRGKGSVCFSHCKFSSDFVNDLLAVRPDDVGLKEPFRDAIGGFESLSLAFQIEVLAMPGDTFEPGGLGAAYEFVAGDRSLAVKESVQDWCIEHGKKTAERWIALVKLSSDLTDGDTGVVKIANSFSPVQIVKLDPICLEFRDRANLLDGSDGLLHVTLIGTEGLRFEGATRRLDQDVIWRTVAQC